MKKLIIEYCNVISYSITGIIFGFSFFLLFLNFYHYKDVNNTYKKQDSDFKYNQSLKEKILKTKDNIDSFNPNSYKGSEDIYSLASVKSRLNVCISKIDSEEFNKILNKKTINIKDVYDMQQFYQINIANECLVKQLYEVATMDNNKIQLSSLEIISPFMVDNINSLIKSTDYLQKVIKNNSSYYFSSNSNKNDLYDQTKDSYYALLNNYTEAIDFIYDVSLWYSEVSK
ncbi:MAG: hypothetical protein Q4E39_00045 [bacterium]|nr:hypothetical protein [bacterium]